MILNRSREYILFTSATVPAGSVRWRAFTKSKIAVGEILKVEPIGNIVTIENCEFLKKNYVNIY